MVNTKEILEKSKTIAVVGCSNSPHKAAHIIPKHMQSQGYAITPINPNSDSVLGKKAYKSIEDVTEKIDIVNIFRPSEEVLEIVKRSIPKKPKYVWMQKWIKNQEAKELANKHGIEVVQNKCIGAEYDRLFKN